MTISFVTLPCVRVPGLKEDVVRLLNCVVLDGLSPFRGHGGVRYAGDSIALRGE
jgi:hypothetical protein